MFKIIRSYMSIGLIIILLISLSSFTYTQADEYRHFTVTAYYSPLPNQVYYLTGDYEREKRLNGQGIAGASGKKVFSGMLAAPGSYTFGTKIELEGIGVGIVEDRGGAIVSAGNRGYNHDRIDIWVGYGDEGLRRALYWGKRTIKGKIVSSDTQSYIKIENLPAPDWVTNNIGAQRNASGVMFQSTSVGQKEIPEQQIPQIQERKLFQTGLGKDDNGVYVEELQKILISLGYLSEGYKSGKYDTHTIAAVYNLQKEYNIVQNNNTSGAGYFGPKTRAKLKEVYNEYLEILEEEKIYHAMIDSLLESARDTAEEKVLMLGNPTHGDISPQVRELQKILRNLGHFERNDTAIFGNQTRDAIIDFQISHKVIKDKTDAGAGMFGPNTREKMVEELTRINFQKLLEENEIYEEYISRKQEIELAEKVIENHV
ncbi:peptidoglycan-binding protein [Candidatus Gracilibacteria bacterium]|nr:peptidoglycan-binding protein [Candidatus Gracilibacteria bacterium]